MGILPSFNFTYSVECWGFDDKLLNDFLSEALQQYSDC